MTLRVNFPAKTAFLFEPHRFKCLYGGRGSSKSWSFARALIILGRRRKLFIVCAREIQHSIKESVHKLIADQIAELGYGDFYRIKENEIEGVNGTKFAFVGIRNNVASIKSMEAIDIFAVFEAAMVSANSWDVVLPTVRRDPPYGPFDQGSEIWVEFNPELETDETYKRFVLDPPTDCVSVEMNWNDNPFFPSLLRRQKDEMVIKDPDNYRTIWEGKTRKALKGAIFARELETAIKEGRLSPHIKIDPTRPCIFSFDLGDHDVCAWWAWQQLGTEHNAVAYYDNTGFGIDHYLDEIERRKLKVKMILLPHDAAQAHQAARGHALGNTIEKQVRAVYGDKVRIVPLVSKVNRINATRALFPRINIAEGACSDGVSKLARFRYKTNDRGQVSSQPDHEDSDPADAFTYYPVWLREGTREEKAAARIVEPAFIAPSAQSWMG
ncbi:MAG TPA: PBSX family phage terminase large subunit [Pseudolabrys sp.]|nr:PBSX family phage terminase large subunit [Pseudolabrys sp.]